MQCVGLGEKKGVRKHISRFANFSKHTSFRKKMGRAQNRRFSSRPLGGAFSLRRLFSSLLEYGRLSACIPQLEGGGSTTRLARSNDFLTRFKQPNNRQESSAEGTRVCRQSIHLFRGRVSSKEKKDKYCRDKSESVAGLTVCVLFVPVARESYFEKKNCALPSEDLHSLSVRSTHIRDKRKKERKKKLVELVASSRHLVNFFETLRIMISFRGE